MADIAFAAGLFFLLVALWLVLEVRGNHCDR